MASNSPHTIKDLKLDDSCAMHIESYKFRRLFWVEGYIIKEGTNSRYVTARSTHGHVCRYARDGGDEVHGQKRARGPGRISILDAEHRFLIEKDRDEEKDCELRNSYIVYITGVNLLSFRTEDLGKIAKLIVELEPVAKTQLTFEAELSYA